MGPHSNLAKITANKNFLVLVLSPSGSFPFFPHLLAWINFPSLQVLYGCPVWSCLCTFSYIFVPCQIHIIIHSYMIRQHENRQEKRAQVSYFIERESFSAQGVARVRSGWLEMDVPRKTRSPDRRGIGKWKLMNEIWYNSRLIPVQSSMASSGFYMLL